MYKKITIEVDGSEGQIHEMVESIKFQFMEYFPEFVIKEETDNVEISGPTGKVVLSKLEMSTLVNYCTDDDLREKIQKFS